MSTLISGNLLTLDNQSLDTTSYSWTAGANCSVARNTSVYKVTPASITLTMTSTTTYADFTGGYPTISFPVGTPTLSAGASVRGTAATNVTITFGWTDATNTFIRADAYALGNCGAGSFTDLAGASYAPPSNAAGAEIKFGVSAGSISSGSVFYFDEMYVSIPTAVPIANAGQDVTEDTASLVQLTGLGTTPNGTITSYLWREVSGPSTTLSSTTVQNPTFTPPSSGTYVFGLKVTNSSSVQSAEDTVTVTAIDGHPITVKRGGVVVSARRYVKRGGVLL